MKVAVAKIWESLYEVI